MKRDPIAEWRNAQRKRSMSNWLPVTRTFSGSDVMRPLDSGRSLVPLSFGSDTLAPTDLSTTRDLSISNPSGEEFATTIRLLQRHNKLVQARFGVGWPDAAIVLLAEAHRRGVSVAIVTRRCIADLRGGAPQPGGAHAV